MSASKAEDIGAVGGGKLPEGWAWATLGDIAEVRLGRQRSPKYVQGDQMRPYIRAANVDWNGLRLGDVKRMNFTDDEADVYRLCPGDIVLNEASGSASQVGKPALWSGEIEDCCFQNTLLRVRLGGGEPHYFLRYLWYVAAGGGFANATRGVGIHHLGAAKLQCWPVPVPPAAEQHRIAVALGTRLARLDAIEYKLRVVLGHVDRTWATVLDAVATGSIPGVESASPMDLPVETVAEVRGGIQKQSRRRPEDNPHPFLRVANVGRGTLDLADVHMVELFDDEIDRYRLKGGDLLVVEGNGSADQIGRAAIWHGEIEDSVHQNHLIRVRPGVELVPDYLELVWNSPTMSRRLQEASVSTSGLYTLSTRKIKELKLPVATREDQAALVTAAQIARSHLEQVRDTAASALGRITAMRSALLSEAFSGRLVPQNPGDEPAEQLLKQIRVEREAAEADRKAARRSARVSRRATVDDDAPPPARTDDTSLAAGEQTALPLEFSS